ncbi:hypothetical protein EDC01DRAFT_700229 [Geopyxis carbonaria]|nr:hypothetical protein EDC01DRAFT_700229 [Geopyxis carbonaria]
MTIYFAYGSNIYLTQMAHRCPDSKYLGRAVLAGFRIQINGRGYFNIVADATETVEGLCYVLSPADEASLDGYEGVDVDCYSKSEMKIELFEAPEHLRHRRVVEIVEDAELSTDATYIHNPRAGEGPGTSVNSLVYASVLHVSDGVAGNLYKQTVAQGVKDALKLGVSPIYPFKFYNMLNLSMRTANINVPVLGKIKHYCLSKTISMTTYFAYGSNMHLTQMASRCPDSEYLGRAVLAGYRIHINRRGFANIVADATETVEGLCFLISPDDEASLDGYEGVELFCYEKSEIAVQIFEAPPQLRRRVAELVEAAEVDTNKVDTAEVQPQPPPRDGESPGTSVASLVYASVLHVSNGRAGNQYKRMVARGVQDALRLGVSQRYLEEKVGPLVELSKVHWLLRKRRKMQDDAW